jgi:glycine cleavage system H protein
MYPDDLHYTEDHEWIRDDGGVFIVGITSFAAEQLGDVTYVELPELGLEVNVGDETAVVESVKAASDVYSPASGQIADVNDALENNPELVNKDPYGDGWFFKLKDIDASELNALMDATSYAKFVEEQGH